MKSVDVKVAVPRILACPGIDEVVKEHSKDFDGERRAASSEVLCGLLFKIDALDCLVSKFYKPLLHLGNKVLASQADLFSDKVVPVSTVSKALFGTAGRLHGFESCLPFCLVEPFELP